MKQTLGPGAAAAIIVVIVLILGVIGYKMFVGKQSSGTAPAEAQKYMKGSTQGMADHYQPNSGPGAAGGPGGYHPGTPPPGAYTNGLGNH